MKRVLVMGSTGTGMARFRKHLLADLASRSEAVFAVADYERDQDRETVAAHQAIPIHLPLQRAGTNPLRELRTLLRIAQVIRKTRPDLVLLYTIKPVIYGGLACRVLGVSSCYGMITGIGSAFEPDTTGRKTVIRRVVERLYRAALGAMTKVIFQNEDNRRLFVENGLVSDASTVVVPGSGVDPEEYPFHEMRDAGAAIRFLYLGRYLEDKGFTSYLNAARQVKRTHPDAVFLIGGKLDARSGRLERQLLSDAVRDEVAQDLGFVDDVAGCLKSIDVLVLPSHGEGVPRSVLEAMAIGRPVITTDAPGCRDTVEEGVNGRLVSPGDDAELAGAMRDLIERRPLLPVMGRASRDTMLQRFSIERINRMMLEVMGFASQRPAKPEAKKRQRDVRRMPKEEHRQHQAPDHSGESQRKARTRDAAPGQSHAGAREREQNEGRDVSAVDRGTPHHPAVNRDVFGTRDRRGQ